MKKIVKISFLLLAIAFLSFNSSFAQKYAHLNSGNLLEQMPERIDADKKLEDFQKPLIAKGEEMVKALQTKVEKLYADIETGTLSQVKIQERQAALQQEEQAIAKYEREVQAKIVKKRQELLEPILQRVEDAIATVAQEENYNMVFDSSVFNALLYAKDSEDITAKVAQLLGI